MVARLLLPALALPLALAACQEEPKAVAKPDRPVLVQTVAFEPRTPERSFVATIRPRVESDLGFRVPGKVAARLVNVGDAVKAGQPLATLDPTDLAPAAGAGGGRDPGRRRGPRAGGGGAPPDPVAEPERLVDGLRPRPPEGRDRGGARPPRPGRARVVARPQRPLVRDPRGRCGRRHHGDAGRARPGGDRRPGRHPAGAARREGGRHRGAGGADRRDPRRNGHDLAVVRSGPPLCGDAPRALPLGRSDDAHLSGPLLAPGCRREPSRSA